jgi:Ca2+-binding RTX toxin-like protein
MPTYTVSIYNNDPLGILSTTIGGTGTWTGEATPSGTATITDNETGTEGQTIDSNASGGETATADISVGGNTSTSAPIYAEESWTLRDTVTGETFQVITLRVSSGGATGYYTLSEIPLVAGRTYETLDYNTDPDVTAGDPAFSIDDYEAPGEEVDGTAGNDVIDATYVDADGDSVNTGPDTVLAGAGDDSVESGDGNDTVFGETGQDTVISGNGDDYVIGGNDDDLILGGDGNDTLYGGNDPATGQGTGGSNTLSTSFQVIDLGDYADIDPDESNGISENAADLSGSYGDAGNPLYDQRVDATTSDPNGSGNVDGNDNNNTSPETITIGGVAKTIDSVQVYDAVITYTDGDTANITAVVFQTTDGQTYLAPELALNADNTALTAKPIVSIDLGTVVADDGALAADRVDADWQVPVLDSSQDYIDGGAGADSIYGNEGNDTLLGGSGVDTIYGGDGTDSVEGGADADSIFGGAGNDTLIGGTGADSLYGGLGDDEIYLAEGDVAYGGDGDDLFVLGDLGEAGSSTISITGGETGETNGDTLQLTSDVTLADITFSNLDDANGGLSGNFTMADGTVVNFDEIENIICFTPGTRILTAQGERAIETLRQGDMVLTRDNGYQPIRWIGHSTVEGHGKFAPIAIDSNVLDGARRPLLVSPQHRVLFTGYRAELLFGQDEVLVAAKHLVDGYDVRVVERRLVSYFHIMFDRHEVIYAEGAATESFHAGDTGIAAISHEAREEMFTIFPDLRCDPGRHGDTARMCLKAHEARLLLDHRDNFALAA